MKAYAAVAIGVGQVRFQEIEVPEPGPEEVVVRVTTSWISNGTEGSFVRGERIAGDTPRGPDDPLPFPHVPGYQKVGLVERVGSAVTDLVPGQRVFATVSRVSGMFYPSGGHVSPAVTHRSQVWALPTDGDPDAFAGLVLTQVGYNVGLRPALEPGDAAVVIGDGLVGHWSAQTLRHRGARVLLLGRHEDRLARWDGARADSRKADPAEAVRAFAPEGVQVLADTVGAIETVYALLPAMRRDGQISSAGFYGHAGKIDIQRLRNQELTLHTPAGWSKARMDSTRALVAAGALQTLPLVTHRFPAAQAGDAFEAILSKQPGVLGVLLDWPDAS